MADRRRVALVCDECGARNYKTTTKNETDSTERIALKKFCPSCKRHTLHRESK